MEPVLNENGSSNINLLTGKEFEKIAKNAKRLSAESLDYSTRKNNKYMVITKSGKKNSFWF